MRLFQSFVLALLVLLLTGCSRVSLVYSSADFFIEQYADDYLSLNGAQIASWRPALADALARHRQDELPFLAAFFNGLYQGTKRGFDAPTVECLIDSFEDAYRHHLRLAADLAAPLLTSLRPNQIRALQRKFAEDNEDDAKEEKADLNRRAKKRAKRWTESAEWWIGPLSKQQKKIIREATASMPDTSAAWDAYRSDRQAGLIRLLDKKASEEKIRDYLTNWLAEHRDLPRELRRAHIEIRRQVVTLFVRMDASFNATQRTHFEDRLVDLRDDFMSLQKRPRMATIQCPKRG